MTLEVSLKPFYDTSEAAITKTSEEIFRAWAPLLRRCDSCALMLWAADGSEILEYRGNLEDKFDWARYLGDANPPTPPPANDPDRQGGHGRHWLYRAKSAADDLRELEDHRTHSQANRPAHDRQAGPTGCNV